MFWEQLASVLVMFLEGLFGFCFIDRRVIMEQPR